MITSQNVSCYEHKAQGTLKIPAKFPGVADFKEFAYSRILIQSFAWCKSVATEKL